MSDFSGGKNRENLKVVDLFCGAGGFSLGFKQAGFDIIFAVDKDSRALETYQHNFPNVETVEKDVRNLEEIPKADIVIGGPPCPNFSNAKRDKKNPEKGLELVKEFLRLKDTVNPDYWIMENVPQVRHYVDGLEIPKKNVFNCANFGVPQKRKRFFGGGYIEPKPTHAKSKQATLDRDDLKEWVTVGEAIGDLLDGKNAPNHKVQWGTTVEKWKERKEKAPMQKSQEVPTDLDKPSRTILSWIKKNVKHPHLPLVLDGRLRRFTVRECARIQSFPDDFVFKSSKTSQYDQVGRCVPPLMAYRLAEEIKERDADEL